MTVTSYRQRKFKKQQRHWQRRPSRLLKGDSVPPATHNFGGSTFKRMRLVIPIPIDTLIATSPELREMLTFDQNQSGATLMSQRLSVILLLGLALTATIGCGKSPDTKTESLDQASPPKTQPNVAPAPEKKPTSKNESNGAVTHRKPKTASPKTTTPSAKMPAVTANQPQKKKSTKSPLPRDAVFAKLPIQEPVNTMAVSEDGKTMFLAHEVQNRITVWNIKSGKAEATINTPAPRSILCRGDTIYVANFGKGTISMFSPTAGGWKAAGDVALPNPKVYFLSAPGGKFFQDRLLATCMRETGPIKKRVALFVDLKRKSHREFREEIDMSTASVDYTGRYVIIQGMVSHSPRARIIGTYPFRAPEGAASPARQAPGEHRETPLLHQVQRGNYWFGGNRIFTGAPPKQLGGPRGLLVIPESGKPIGYEFARTKLTCFGLDSQLTKIGERNVSYPAALQRFSPNRHPAAREHTDTLFFPHVAVTDGADLNLFVLDNVTKQVFHSRIQSFDVPDAVLAAVPEPELPQFQPTKSVVGKPTLPGTKPNKPAPAKATWKVVTSKAGNYQVSLPGIPRDLTQPADPSSGTGEGHMKVVKLPGNTGTCLVGYADYKEVKVRPAVVLRGVKDGLTKGARVTKRLRRTLGKHLGFEMHYVTKKNGKSVYWQACGYLVGTRLYQQIVMRNDQAVDPDDAKRFFDSFKLSKEPPQK